MDFRSCRQRKIRRAMLAAGGLTADEILGAIAERNAIIPAEKVAINAVMAGCLPDIFSRGAGGRPGALSPGFSLP